MTAVRIELRKFLTTRMWWLLALGMAAYLAFLAGLLAVAFTSPEVIGGDPGETPVPPDAVPATLYTLPAAVAYVFPLIIGTLSVTGEFRYQTITATLLARPRRGGVLAAKAVAALLVGLLLGVVAALTAGAVGGGALAVLGEPTRLGDPETLRTLALTCLTMGVWAVVGVGFGALLTNQVASVITVLAFTQFVEPILRLVLALAEGPGLLARFLPGAAGEALAGGGGGLFGGLTGTEPLEWWQGGLVLLGYGVAFAVAGRLTTFRKDVT